MKALKYLSARLYDTARGSSRLERGRDTPLHSPPIYAIRPFTLRLDKHYATLNATLT